MDAIFSEKAASVRLRAYYDMLGELNDDGTSINEGSGQFYKARTVDDEREHTVTVNTLRELQGRIHKLEKELRAFCSMAHSIASSTDIFTAGAKFRRFLAQLSFAIQYNAGIMFPGKVKKPNYHPVTRDGLPAVRAELYWVVHGLTKACNEFRQSLERFHEFTDIDSSTGIMDPCLRVNLEELKTDLSVNFNVNFNVGVDTRSILCDVSFVPELLLYAHKRVVAIGQHFDSIATSLEELKTVAIPALYHFQHLSSDNLTRLATAATLFSAVAATTLQFSYDMNPRSKASNVLLNTFWFSSLTLSIAAAVGGFLGAAWRLSIHRTPGNEIPWWMLVWTHHRLPLVFLVSSIASFLVGLCVFAYSSNQHAVTFTVTTMLTALTSFGLVVMSIWISFERSGIYQRFSDIKSMFAVLMSTPKSKTPDPEAMDILADEPTEKLLECHKALVNDLQFSPDGQYLCTVSWDSTAHIYARNADAPTTFHFLQRLSHGIDFVHETLWTPTKEKHTILTRTGDSINLFEARNGKFELVTGRLVKHLRAIEWWPNGEYALAVTSTHVMKLKTDVNWGDDTPCQEYTSFGDLALRDVAVMSNENILVVGIPPKGETSTLALYSTASDVPHLMVRVTNLPSDVRAIVLATVPIPPKEASESGTATEEASESGTATAEASESVPAVQSTTKPKYHQLALVSYDYQIPPELWKIEQSAEGDDWLLEKIRTYKSWDITEVSQFCRFGGTEDEFVLCAGKDGGIYVWKRDSGELLRHIDPDKNFRCVGWKDLENNRQIIATGDHRGNVEIRNARILNT